MDILLCLTADGQSAPERTVTVTMPEGCHYADGGVGTRNFQTDAAGQVSVAGVKGSATPGEYTLSAASANARTTARLTVTELPNLGTIDVGGVLDPVVVSPDGTRAYVGNRESNKVSVIDTPSSTVIGDISISQPWGIALSPDGTRAYATNFDLGFVSVIDTDGLAVIDTISVDSYPAYITISPDGTRLYVGHSASISVIEVASRKVIGTIAVSGWPGIVVSPDGTRVYVGTAVIDTVTYTVIGQIAIEGEVKGMALSPDGALAYIAADYETFFSKILVADTVSFTVIETLDVERSSFQIAITPDGAYVCAINLASASVSVLDTAGLTMIRTISVRSFPWGIDFSADGSRAFVCASDGTVSVIAIP